MLPMFRGTWENTVLVFRLREIAFHVLTKTKHRVSDLSDCF